MVKKILELVMIVKNSGAVLKKVLKPFVDAGASVSYTIVDTGSTDGTPALIRSVMAGVDGAVYEEPFVDFATTRNRAFDLSRKDATFQIVLDDSYFIPNLPALLAFLERRASPTKAGYSIRVCSLDESTGHTGDSYYSQRIVRPEVFPRYVGRVHEVMTVRKGELGWIRDPQLHVVDLPDPQHALRSKHRFLRDLRCLREDFKTNPNDDRVLLHLARTYRCLEKYSDATKTYRKLSMVSPNPEYVFHGLMEGFTIDFLHNKASEHYGNSDTFLARTMNVYASFPGRTGETGWAIISCLNDRKEYEAVFNLVKAIYRVPKPELLTTVLNNMIFDFYIPYVFIESNIRFGQFGVAVDALKELMVRFPEEQVLYNLKYAIVEPPVRELTRLPERVLVIHVGKYPFAFSPLSDIDISGSEYMAFNMARELATHFRVLVFGTFNGYDKTGAPQNYEVMDRGVQYLHHDKYRPFLEGHYVDVLVVSRESNNLVYYDNIGQVYLWVHDILPKNNGIPLQISYKKFKGVITLSKWHYDFVLTQTGIDPNFVLQSRNAIHPGRFLNKNIKKKPYSFIYISSPERGLNALADLMPRIKERWPETTLSVYCNLDFIEPDTKATLGGLNYVTLYPRVSQDDIANALLGADVWLYPTDFTETYCISCLEAMCAGCLVVTTDTGALGGLCAENRGVLAPSPCDPDVVFKRLCVALDSPALKAVIVKNGQSWALEQTYGALAAEWLTLFNSF